MPKLSEVRIKIRKNIGFEKPATLHGYEGIEAAGGLAQPAVRFQRWSSVLAPVISELRTIETERRDERKRQLSAGEEWIEMLKEKAKAKKTKPALKRARKSSTPDRTIKIEDDPTGPTGGIPADPPVEARAPRSKARS